MKKVCKHCGSDAVLRKYWHDVNTGEIQEPGEDTYWCCGCSDYTDVVDECEYPRYKLKRILRDIADYTDCNARSFSEMYLLMRKSGWIEQPRLPKRIETMSDVMLAFGYVAEVLGEMPYNVDVNDELSQIYDDCFYVVKEIVGEDFADEILREVANEFYNAIITNKH